MPGRVRPAGRRRALAVLALVVGSTGVALLGIELGLRIAHLQVTDRMYNVRKYGRLIGYDAEGGFTLPRPNARTFAFGVDMRFNSQGMRDLERPLGKPPGTRRVLVLGDSNVVGLGVTADETFVRRLEPLLNDGTGQPVEVVAAGVSGWNTVAERNWLRTRGLAFAPDVVVLIYVGNDNEIDVPWAPRPPSSWLHRSWQWLADRSRLVELGTYAYRQYRPLRPDAADIRALSDMRRTQAQRRAQPHNFEPDDPGWLASRAALLDIAEVARGRGIGLLVVAMHFGGGSTEALLARLREFSGETGVRVIDAQPWFAHRPVESLVNSSLHPNAEGHAILAAGIARALAEDMPAR
jgi:lysophospholipase L1-like esterase